jgi:hypothetical protein
MATGIGTFEVSPTDSSMPSNSANPSTSSVIRRIDHQLSVGVDHRHFMVTLGPVDPAEYVQIGYLP